MSISNVYIDPDFALVAVDTHGQGIAIGDVKTLAHYQKSAVIGDVVVSCRGQLKLFEIVLGGLHQSSTYWSIDQMEAVLPHVTQQALPLLSRYVADNDIEIEPEHIEGGTEIVAVGWSESKQQMRGICVTAGLGGSDDIQVDRIRSSMSAPGVEGVDGDRMRTYAGMVEAAKMQCAYARETHGEGYAIGGNLIVYEIHSDSIKATRVGAI